MRETSRRLEVQLTKLHPFFSNPAALCDTNNQVANPPTPDPSCSPASDKLASHPVDSDHLDDGCPEPKQKRRKKNDSVSVKTLPIVSKRKLRPRPSAGHSIKPPSEIVKEEIDVDKTQADGHNKDPSRHDTNESLIQPSTSAVKTDHAAVAEQEKGKVTTLRCDPKPQKLLKLNLRTGTIGSPPRPKPSALKSAKSSAKRILKSKVFTVTIPYGVDSASRERIGKKIQQLFSAPKSIITPNIAADSVSQASPTNQDNAAVATTPPKRAQQKSTTSQKSSRTFFQAKGKSVPSEDNDKQKAVEETARPKRQVVFTSTPCPPKSTRPTPSSFSVPTPGSRNGVLKIPGAQHPAWPWREIVHIRDIPHSDLSDLANSLLLTTSSGRRKAKGQATQISQQESILCGTAPMMRLHQLIDNLKLTNDHGFGRISPLIRVPIRHFESGQKLQSRVSKELTTLRKKDDSSETHPAILHAYHSVATTLSAFDKSTCESVAWAQKYAPTSAGLVLQNGRQAVLLRDWLETLEVQAVDKGLSNNSSKAKTTSAPPKKRRRKDLDGFIVSSDSETDDMDEISEDELQWLGLGGQGQVRKSLVRSADATDRRGKLPNAVLLSGPHGSGKTATVYAIAKELDFEVFEINAGARRSGKDILERVGDMTRNHLVHHQKKEKTQEGTATDDEVANDLKSGKQGMMTSFFKPKSGQSTKEPKKADNTAESQVPASQEKKLNGDKKQSLILLEEVDILYEEDKQFWTTVISMIAQSKRPFIMTCNDESAVPFHTLKLHGIFRFSSPPTDHAVDLLLLIAANEGHALERQAIETLYESRGNDLRASIAELQYWCQIGVGDPRGGFDWFYPRWPRGSDVDAKGHTIRVVSQDTYLTGMGWFSRDLADTESLWPSTTPQVQGEIWDHWGLDISDRSKLEDASDWYHKATEQTTSRAARVDLLRSVEAFADSVSDSDICGHFLPPQSNHIALDATTPHLHAKTLGDYTIDCSVLEATLLDQYSSISPGVSTSLRILALSELQGSHPFPEDAYSTKRFDEKQTTGDIKHHLKMSSQSDTSITRVDYSLAFDPIAASERTLANGYLDPSVFDREMTPICLDVAPYVRSIVAYDQRLLDGRRMQSNLVSQGGRRDKKRMRRTRAALSALEGGSRAAMRRERYFSVDINPYLVMRTSGEGWDELAHQTGRSSDTANADRERRDMTQDEDGTSDSS